MRIICDDCQTEYDLTEQEERAFSEGQGLKFRCSYCGHIFTPDIGERRRAWDDASAPEPEGSGGPEESGAEGPPVAPAAPHHEEDPTADPEAPSDDADSVDTLEEGEDNTPSWRALPPPVASNPSPTASDPGAVYGGGSSLYLKQEGQKYHVPDIATLQRWIVEGRVLAADLVSREGVRWEPVGQQSDLQPFFELLEQRNEASEAPMRQGIQEPTPPELGWAGLDDDTMPQHGEPAEDPASESTRPTDSGAISDTHEADSETSLLVEPEEPTTDDTPTVNLGYRSPELPEREPTPHRPPGAPTSPAPSAGIAPAADAPPSARDRAARKKSESSGVSWSQITLAILVVAVVLFTIGLYIFTHRGSRTPASTQGTPTPADPSATVSAPQGQPTQPPPSTRPAPQPPPPKQEPPSKAEPPTESPAEGKPATASGKPKADEAEPEESSTEQSPPATAQAEPEPEPAEKESTSSSSRQPLSSAATARNLVERGWEDIGRKDYGKARQRFVDATALDPTNEWAFYGLAYAADKQGDIRTARDAYCRAWSVGQGDIDLMREVEGRLRVHGLQCQ